jgi:CRP-like cAMP-binding protein
MRTHRLYLEELAGVPLFEGCWRQDLELVAREVDIVDLADGAVVAAEGRTGHELYVVVAGAAAVSRSGRPVGMLGPGDWFGEGPALAGARHPATVTATGGLRLVVIGRRQLLGLVQAVPGLARRLLRGMAERLGKNDGAGTVAGPDDPGEATEPRRPLRA